MNFVSALYSGLGEWYYDERNCFFNDGTVQLEVPISSDGESVWLSANQMAILFEKDETNIRKHINNIFNSMEVDLMNNTQKMRVVGVKQPVAFYSCVMQLRICRDEERRFV